MAFLRCFGYKLIRRGGVADARVFVEDDKDDELDCTTIKGQVTRYTSCELKKFTMNFSTSKLIACGGFSTVYLAEFPNSTLGAVKIMDSSSERLNRIYKQELDILLQIQHDNIVKLLDHCDDAELGNMLVFEYVPNGTLQDKLHGKRDTIIPWRNRMTVAFQLAQAIEYLHDKCPLQIVHSDIKASNILLDKQFNCKLCDFGSAKMGFSSSVLPPTNRMMLGSPGYTDPHYLRTGIASKKNDIYSFGAVTLELISGVEAFSSDTGERLISKAAPILNNVSKVAEMVDPSLNGDYELEEAKAMASLAALCLSDCSSLRPSASEILEVMRSRISSISFLCSADKKVLVY
ncbi:PREDICTED: probable receptor-like protein kinase At4g10390 [Nicotiana attenuata]|uniref:non-specific serine/threonine protein kinase n=1 Tax=Nicotiana attenuata TaxID=49451 RepID=A0A1J6K2X5_NICAT|nr:PREDICTED: probable receptor-like protein kinase At4g10390 [Nicotiana attenuata]XP_019235986.1 PREDICTED: probable receptor-like protein kinase At4g10390 [Nicotiana attenuata]OIT24405.1 putative receptor-like protein kinase [Nicotiana attenuata]OIT27794.1 putative receptor-like protein kinase [Nicotiana attenuata]